MRHFQSSGMQHSPCLQRFRFAPKSTYAMLLRVENTEAVRDSLIILSSARWEHHKRSLRAPWTQKHRPLLPLLAILDNLQSAMPHRDEIVLLAKNIEKAGASIINTGIGWHEARIPTIATSVPRAGFSWVTKKLKGEVSLKSSGCQCAVCGCRTLA